MDATGNQDCPTTNQISIFHSFNALCGPSREVFPGTMKLKTIASKIKLNNPTNLEWLFKSTMCIEIETTHLHTTI